MSFEGIIPAVTTPFEDDLAIDTEALASNVGKLIDAGIHGIVGTGTMGESGSLSREERRQVLETIVGVADDRVPVIAGIAATTPAVATQYATDAKAAGAAGLMCLPPLLYDGGYEEIAAYFRAICGAVDLPVIAYNNPHAAGYDLSVETVVRLSRDIDQIIQVKECSGDVRRIPAIVGESGGSLGVLVGGDDWSFEGLCVGAEGWISGVADVLPAECVELFELVKGGNLERGRGLYLRLLPMARFDMTPKLVQYYKAGMDEVGLTGGCTRPPRLDLTEQERADLSAALSLVRGASVA